MQPDNNPPFDNRKGKGKVNEVSRSRFLAQIFGDEYSDHETQSSVDDNMYEEVEACCYICKNPWSSQGHHQLSCLPCGHVYGFSCIIGRRLAHPQNYTQCPQCKEFSELKDIRKLYTSLAMSTQDEHLTKKLRHLEAENECLKMERSQLSEIIHKLNIERTSPMLQNQLKDIFAERDELSRMKALVAAVKDRLMIFEMLDSSKSTALSHDTNVDTAQLDNEILERLRKIELRVFTAEDQVFRLQNEITQQCADIVAAVRQLSGRAGSGGATSGSKDQDLNGYISVHEVVQLVMKLSQWASLSPTDTGNDKEICISDD